jgi:tetratricopeptide (TPR) repeat protein
MPAARQGWRRPAAAGLAAMLLLLLLLLIVSSAGCARRQDFFLEELKKTEAGRAGQVDDRRIGELEAGIRRYRQEVDRKVRASDQLGVYYRMLAVRYLQLGMFQQAYGALQEALKIYPENPILFYYAGICAARLGQAQLEPEERRQWLERAERHYRRALELDPLHSETLYALAVLYVYELGRPKEAEGLLVRLLEREKKNTEALFLLGNVYYATGRLEEALEVYRRLQGLRLPEEKRRKADENIRTIEEELHGAR